MRDLTLVAEQLRTVRQAQQAFIHLWAMEKTVIQPGLDRVAADVASARSKGSDGEFTRDCLGSAE